MIRSVWLKIALLLALAVVPVTLLQLTMERESLELVFELTAKLPLPATLDQHLRLLKTAAGLDAAHSADYHAQFDEVVAAKQALEDFHRLKAGLIRDIRGQAIRNATIILVLSLMLSLAVSSRIVRDIRGLLEEQRLAALKLSKLASLQRWQDIARMLVHELKAPITPIKLIATDIEQRYAALSAEDFGNYLSRSQALIRQQVAGIETMVQSFTRFAKLPPVAREKTPVRPFLAEFASLYGPELEGRATLTCEDSLPPGQEAVFDPKLLRDLLYNLTKNAVEANAGQRIAVRIVAFREAATLMLRVQNSGTTVPAELAKVMFEPYVSGGHGGDGAFNMGLGLSICRKIAFDHGGDLYLLYNDAPSGVVFECSLPQAFMAELS